MQRVDEELRIVPEDLWNAAQAGLQSRRILATIGV